MDLRFQYHRRALTDGHTWAGLQGHSRIVRGSFDMSEPTISCPHCNAEVTLTESRTPSLIQLRQKIAEKEAEIARRESAIRAQRGELARAVESIEKRFTTRLKTERERIAAEEATKAQLLSATDLESRAQEIAGLQREIQERDSNLAEAQKTQAELLRKMDLQIETRVQESLSVIRHKAKQEAEDAMNQNIMEKEEKIASTQRQLEELNLLFQYLTGPRFRRRIEAIVEKFSVMQTDLERERKTMMRLRARREGQIREVIESTVGMYGDLQGIAGKALEEINGLAQIARRVEARRKRGPENHRAEPSARGRTH